MDDRRPAPTAFLFARDGALKPLILRTS